MFAQFPIASHHIMLLCTLCQPSSSANLITGIDFLEDIIRARYHGNGQYLPGQNEKYVLLGALVAETRDPVELRHQILQLLHADRDTASALLS